MNERDIVRYSMYFDCLWGFTSFHQVTRGIHTDCLFNYETVKYFGGECHELGRYRDSINQYQTLEYRVMAALNFLNLVQNFIIVGFGPHCHRACVSSFFCIILDSWSPGRVYARRLPGIYWGSSAPWLRVLHYLFSSGEASLPQMFLLWLTGNVSALWSSQHVGVHLSLCQSVTHRYWETSEPSWRAHGN